MYSPTNCGSPGRTLSGLSRLARRTARSSLRPCGGTSSLRLVVVPAEPPGALDGPDDRRPLRCESIHGWRTQRRQLQARVMTLLSGSLQPLELLDRASQSVKRELRSGSYPTSSGQLAPLPVWISARLPPSRRSFETPDGALPLGARLPRAFPAGLRTEPTETASIVGYSRTITNSTRANLTQLWSRSGTSFKLFQCTKRRPCHLLAYCHRGNG